MGENANWPNPCAKMEFDLPQFLVQTPRVWRVPPGAGQRALAGTPRLRQNPGTKALLARRLAAAKAPCEPRVVHGVEARCANGLRQTSLGPPRRAIEGEPGQEDAVDQVVGHLAVVRGTAGRRR